MLRADDSNAADFGTTIALSIIARDFQQSGSDPNNPPTPEQERQEVRNTIRQFVRTAGNR
jgi:hypothetical protein